MSIDLDNDKKIQNIELVCSRWMGGIKCCTDIKLIVEAELYEDEDGRLYVNVDIDNLLEQYNNR